MAILRVGQAKLLLQPQLPGGGVQQIAAPHHLGDPLKGVVHHHRQLIGVHPVRAAEDKVPALRRQVLGTVPLELIPEGDRLLRDRAARASGARWRQRPEYRAAPSDRWGAEAASRWARVQKQG